MLIGNIGSLKNIETSDRLEGYGWIDSNLIVGTGGLDSYFKESCLSSRTNFLSNLRDGCFNILLKGNASSDSIFATDPFGYGKIYTYISGSAWAASSSWAELFYFLKNNNVSLTPNISFFEHMQGDKGINEQLISYDTAVIEIKLLPQWKQICFNESTMTQRILSSNNFYSCVNEAEQATYKKVLSDWIDKWKARALTIARSGLNTLVDVSGGYDSRVSFALFSQIRSTFTSQNALRFRTSPSCLPNGDKTLDQRVSDLLGESQNLEVSRDYFYQPRELKFRGADGAWVNFLYSQLGTYKPMILNAGPGLADLNLRLAGGGGENYRTLSLYRINKLSTENELDAFFDKSERHYLDDKNKSKVKASFLKYFSSVQDCLIDEDDLLRGHYLSFRNRFHFGVNMHTQMYLYPLSDLSLIISFNGHKKTNVNSSVYLDLIHNLNPILAFIPFDEKSKNFTIEEVEAITKVSPLSNVLPGTVYSGDLRSEFDDVSKGIPDDSFCKGEFKTSVDILIDESNKALNGLNKIHSEFVNEGYLSELKMALEETKDTREIGNKKNINRLHMAILLNMVFNY